MNINEYVPEDTSIPPVLPKRNCNGLYSDGVKYIYSPDGRAIDWKAMINPKYLAPNRQNFEKWGKPVPKTIDGLEDKDLLVLLGGYKELAQIRGYNSVNYSIAAPTNDYVAICCRIEWIPNFETENRPIVFSAIGDASPFNSTNFGKMFLGPTAENRAFVRTVRNFLKINIVAQEEIVPSGVSQEAENLDVSGDLLSQTMAVNGVTWEKLKAKLIEEKVDGAENFASAYDIPKFKQFELIERIKKKAAAAKKA